MARRARASPGGWAYHVINRGNHGVQIFAHDGDYAAFLQAMADALKSRPMRILGWCLMPNHWHLVLWPAHDGELSAFVGWISNTHVRRYNRFHNLDGWGHLYQGRFRSFPIQEDYHLLTVLRYVEANALRAKIVQRAQDWPWCSLATRVAREGTMPTRWASLLTPWPVDQPENWLQLVNNDFGPEELSKVRESVQRGRPYGTDSWSEHIAGHMGLGHTLRDPGRPRKQAIATSP